MLKSYNQITDYPLTIDDHFHDRAPRKGVFSTGIITVILAVWFAADVVLLVFGGILFAIFLRS